MRGHNIPFIWKIRKIILLLALLSGADRLLRNIGEMLHSVALDRIQTISPNYITGHMSNDKSCNGAMSNTG